MSPGSHLPNNPQGGETLARGLAIGRYVVLGLVGRGGMGEVYAAYDPELDRKVAIKLLRSGAHSRSSQDGSARARMLREAQAIARLSHPNVVGVYDVGTFLGQVFIAMEFVDGQTVGYWMNAQSRTWPEVLKVFIAAGRGLSAAHDKQLIHRDFKPDNVMLTADGQVRVMDFGLVRVASDRKPSPARLAALNLKRFDVTATGAEITDDNLESTRSLDLQSASTADTLQVTAAVLDSELTQTGSMLGTPAYMAPEQFQSQTIDARTDQFSFCVALHEALYAERPFEGKTVRSLSASVIQGRVRPAPAQTKVPSWLRKVLLRGLNPNPDERWPSMDALLSELETHRAVAGRDRFAAGAATKLAGIWEAPARGQRRETAAKTTIHGAFAATGRHYAADTFTNVSRILDRYATAWSEMYVSACEENARGEQSSDVLDLRMAALDEALAALRALCQAFRGATAEMIESAIDAANALPRIERCADIKLLRAVVAPPDDPVIRAAVDRIREQLAEVRISSRVGRVAAALKISAPLEEQVRQLRYQPLLAELLLDKASLLLERGDWEPAGRVFEDAVWLAELSRHDEVAAEATTQLVGVMAFQARFDAADIWAKHAETILRRMGGQDRLWAWLFNNLGAMRRWQGRLAEGLEQMQRAVAAREKAFGPDHPDVALSLSNVAVLLVETGQLAEALPYIQRAIASSETGLGPDHPRTASALANGAEILNKLGRYQEARRMSQRALTVFERETEPEGACVATALVALGIGYLDDGMVDQALPLLERAAKNRAANETDPSRLAEVHFALGRALSSPGHDQERGRALALRARTECERAVQSPASQRTLAAIDHWLAAQLPA